MGQLIRPDTPPQMPKLHTSRVKLQDVLKPSYWEQLCPGLHVTDEQFMAKVSSIQLPTTRLDDLKEQVNYAGVAQVSLLVDSQLCICQVQHLLLLLSTIHLFTSGQHNELRDTLCLNTNPPFFQ